MRVLLYAIFFIFFVVNVAGAAEITLDNNIQTLNVQQFGLQPKLYVPHFVMTGENATFKVFTAPYKTVKFVLDYGYSIDKTIMQIKANDKGVAVFNVAIVNNKDFVGKSVGVDAYIFDENSTASVQKAVMLNGQGQIISSNRVEIVDNESAKGFHIAPWQAVNEFVMNASYDEKSGFNPITDQIYDNKTPAYVKNMRDAQENVRTIPANFNSPDR